MSDWQQRVVEEMNQLEDRINKLNEFRTTEIFRSLPWQERIKLQDQMTVMRQYCHILVDRINHF